MAESLNDVIKKLKEQNAHAQPAQPPRPVGRPSKEAEKKPEFVLPTPEELNALEDENGDLPPEYEDDEEDAEKEAPQKPQVATKESKPMDNTLKIADILRDLQDNGIYRLRMLTILEKMAESMASMDANIKSLCEYYALQNGK